MNTRGDSIDRRSKRNLSVTTGAALSGNYGLRANVADNTAKYLEDDGPNGETEYGALHLRSP
jgi:hypothetical protein